MAKVQIKSEKLISFGVFLFLLYSNLTICLYPFSCRPRTTQEEQSLILRYDKGVNSVKLRSRSEQEANLH